MRNFGYVIDGELAGLAHPGTGPEAATVLAALHASGIRALVSLDEVGVEPRLAAEHGLRHHHIPVTDFEAPTVEQAAEFVGFVERSLAAGEPVAAHCQAGIGRTGTMLACYLISTGLDVDESVAEVRNRRPMSIESASQRRFLDDFAANLR